MKTIVVESDSNSLGDGGLQRISSIESLAGMDSTPVTKSTIADQINPANTGCIKALRKRYEVA